MEIERKFLVKNESFKSESFKEKRIVQGFLSSVPERTVRVRIENNACFLTVKGIGNQSGTTRFEWEKEISLEEATKLLTICEPGVIKKMRFHIRSGEHIFEVDEFFGDNKGLIIAEVELNSEDENYIKPDWLGDEVTGNIRYYNSNLLNNPFKDW